MTMEELIIRNIKTLGIDMIKEAESGHPGIVLDAAPMMYTLFAKHFIYNTNDPHWLNRDRFVLSSGHGSALLYATMFLCGYPLTLDDLKKFRKYGSKTPGHPEYGITEGVEVSTGPLGQGIATAVGLALGEKILENNFTIENKKNKTEKMFDYHVYCLCGDGDLMEGVALEAISLAGTWKLNHLIVLYDCNSVSLDGDTKHTLNEDIVKRFEACHWNVLEVDNGNDIKDIDRALEKAKKSSQPTLIKIKTKIGDGSLLEGTNAVHGKVLDDQDMIQLKHKLGMPETPFYYHEGAKKTFTSFLANHTSSKYQEWANEYRTYQSEAGEELPKQLKFLFHRDEFIDLSKLDWQLPDEEEKIALRDVNQIVMEEIAKHYPYLLGGSADLATSTKVYLKNYPDIVNENNYVGRNIWFGVREHAMGAILNGLALTGFHPYGSTFLSFSDYLKPAIRMTALMDLPVTYIFTHDDITIGSDGPTHQPVEQLAMLRAIPNLNVYRPCDMKEIIGCWNEIFKSKKPSAIILSKNPVQTISNSSIDQVANGAYIIGKERNTLHGILIATGCEVQTALRLKEKLYHEEGIDIRVVSMVCMENFLKQPKEYQEHILTPYIKTFVLEYSSSLSWYRFVYNDKFLFTMDNFGASGSKDDVLKANQLDFDSILNKMIDIIK